MKKAKRAQFLNKEMYLVESNPLANILYVEDDPSAVNLVCQLFKQHKFKIDVCHSAEDAIKLLESKTYDLLLLDIALPGISGKELSKKLSELFVSPPAVIFLSALAKDYEAHGTPPDRTWEKAYIQKPIPYAELISVVNHQIKAIKGAAFDEIWPDKIANKDFLSVTLQHYHLLESQSFVQSAPFLASLISSLSHEMGNSLLTIQVVSSLLKNKEHMKDNDFEDETELLIGASNRLCEIMKGLVELARSGFGGQRKESVLDSISIKNILSLAVFISTAYLEKQGVKVQLALQCRDVSISGQLGELVKLLLFAVDEFYDSSKNVKSQKMINFFTRVDEITQKPIFGVELESCDESSLNPVSLTSPALLCAKAISEQRGLLFEIFQSSQKQVMTLTLTKEILPENFSFNIQD